MHARSAGSSAGSTHTPQGSQRAHARAHQPGAHGDAHGTATKPPVQIVIYTDFKLDESYTPAKISIRSGTTFHDLQEIHVQELHEPSGWHTILPPRDAATATESGALLRTHFIQVAVLANHQNGRDTHIRQIKIFTPRRLMGQHMNLPEFDTVSFQQFACLR